MVLAEGKARAKAPVRTAWHVQGDKTTGWTPEVGATVGKTRPERQTTEGLMCYALELWLMEENLARAEGDKHGEAGTGQVLPGRVAGWYPAVRGEGRCPGSTLNTRWEVRH